MKLLTDYPKQIMNKLASDERETSINWTTEDRRNSVVDIFTNDPTEYAKLVKKGHIPYLCDGTMGCFKLEYRFVSVRTNREKRHYSDEERAAAGERLKENRAKAKAEEGEQT